MTIALAQLVVVLALVVVLVARERDHDNRTADAADLARHEREALLDVLRTERAEHLAQVQELVNKLQHPNVYRPAPQQPFPHEPPRPDGFELAGREALTDEDMQRLVDTFDEHIDTGEPVTP